MTLGRMKTVDKVLLYLAVASACLLIGFPVYWMLITSLQDQARLLTLPPAFLAVPPRVEGYAAVVKEFPIWTWMVNSLVVALASTAFSVLFSILSEWLVAVQIRGQRHIRPVDTSHTDAAGNSDHNTSVSCSQVSSCSTRSGG